MTEPAVKTRVLTKVRRQYLHKRPPGEDEVDDNTTIIATPEQLNDNTARLLEPLFGLVETNRKIYAGHQFLNLNYKIANLRVEGQVLSKAVTIDIQRNGVDILPWEYCVERLESYGDLELATWASRLKIYHKNYAEMIGRYLEIMNSTDPQIMEAIEKGKAQAMQVCRDIESKYVYRKIVLYGNRSSVVPVSLTLHEGLLNDLGHSVDGFVKWTKKHGIPGLYKRDYSVLLEHCKQRLVSGGAQSPLTFVQEGPEQTAEIYDKKGGKKLTRLKVFLITIPARGGFLLTVYSIRKDLELAEIPSKTDECTDIAPDRKAPKSEQRGPEFDESNINEPFCINNTSETGPLS